MVNESPRGGGCTGTTATIWEKLLETRGELYARALLGSPRVTYVRTYVAASIPIHFREADAHARKRRIRGERRVEIPLAFLLRDV